MQMKSDCSESTKSRREELIAAVGKVGISEAVRRIAERERLRLCRNGHSSMTDEQTTETWSDWRGDYHPGWSPTWQWALRRLRLYVLTALAGAAVFGLFTLVYNLV